MYQYFYITMLIGAILLGITGIMTGTFSKQHMKIWARITMSIAVITVMASIGFVVTLAIGGN